MADFLAIILALITLYPIVKAMKIKERLSPLIELLHKEGKVSRVIISLILIATIGIGSNKDFLPWVLTNGVSPEVSLPTNGVQQTQLMGIDGDGNPVTFILINTPVIPEWYLQTGYSPDDSDGDGIPDMWERLTRTDPNVNDGGADYDGDGVTNYEEFLAALDPHLGDTDGDRISDGEELERQNQGETGFDPLEPIDYTHDEPDSDNNGIPDYWEDCGYPYGVNNLVLPPGTDDTFDAQITVTTTASALLKWSGGGVVLPPCTNQVVTVRVTATTDGEISLTPHEATESGYVWEGNMRLGLPIPNSRNRVMLGELRFIEFESSETEWQKTVQIPMVRGLQDKPGLLYLYRELDIRIMRYPICSIHGGIHSVYIIANQGLPTRFMWMIDNVPYEIYDIESYHDISVDAGSTIRLVEVNEYGDPQSTIIDYTVGYVESTYTCWEEKKVINGASWTSTHNHLNPSNHAPKPKEEKEVQFYNSACPTGIRKTYTVGFAHNTTIMWLRNLPYIADITTNPYFEISTPDHCISKKGKRGDTINLWSYLEAGYEEVRDELAFRVSQPGQLRQDTDGILTVNCDIEDLEPIVADVALISKDGTVVYDNFVLVVYCEEQEQLFNSWYNSNTNISWTTSLPRPPQRIVFDNGEPVKAPGTDNRWSNPKTIDSYLHHNAKYEMRTEMWGQYGNQATFDENGNIITSTIAAGTADLYGPYNGLGLAGDAWNHRIFDVLPFLRAVQQDGNPGVPNDLLVPKHLSRPCIYQGDHLNKYLQLRPIIQPQQGE